MTERKIVIGGLDLETTGLFAQEHRIIEVAIGRWEVDQATFAHRELDFLTQRIDPKRSIEKKAREVHGIAETDLIGKPTFDEVAPALKDALDSCDIVVAHNGNEFDVPFLIQEFERVRCPLPDFIPFDTMLEGRWATAMGAVPNLGALCWACGVPYDRELAHAADYDVRTMMECYFFGLRRGVFKITGIT